MDEELGYSKYDYRNKDTENSRNGYSKRLCIPVMETWISMFQETVKVSLTTGRKKYQNTVTQDMEEKILSMYARGMPTSDTESHMRELYDIDVSDTTISCITDKVLPLIKE